MASGTANLESTGSPSEARFIEQQLDRTRRQVKLVDLFGGLLLLAVGVLGFLLLVAVVDAWLFDLGRWGRVLALLTVVCGALAYLAIYVVPLIFRKVNPVYAARTIEQAQPSLKNGLINFLMFRSEPKQVEQVVFRELEHEAAVGLSHVPIETAVDRSKLIRLACVAAGVLAACAVYAIASPKNPLTTIARVAAPLADIDRPTRVQIDHRVWKRRVTDMDVKTWGNHEAFKQLRRNDWLIRFDNDEPTSSSSSWEEISTGHLQIYHGAKLGIEARIEGVGDDDAVTLIYSTADGKTVDQRISLQSDGTYYQQVLSPNSFGIQEDLSYYLSAGDARSRALDVRVYTAPTITVERIQYDYPTYTDRPPQSIEGQGDVKALEGTKVTVTATANLPIKSAEIILRSADDSDEPQRSQSVTMSVKDHQAVGRFLLELRADRETPAFAEYVVHFTTVDGYENENPAEYRIEVIPDLTPEVEILTPRRERIGLPADRSQTIEVRALDPDFALRQVSLRAASAGTDLLNVVLLNAGANKDKANEERQLPDEGAAGQSVKNLGHLGQAVATYEFRPGSLKLKPGDEVVFWAVAQDNRLGVRHQLPEPNVSRTSNYYIKITPPEKSRGSDSKADSPKDDEKDDSKKEEEDEEDSGESGGGEKGAQSTGAGSAEQGDSGEADKGDASGGNSSGSDSSTADAGEGGDGGSNAASSSSNSDPSGDSQSNGTKSAESGSSKSSENDSGTNDGSNTPAAEDGTANSFESSGSNAGEGVGNSEISGKPDLENASVERNEDVESEESQSDEPLHEGEVFEKILEHLKNKKEDASGGSENSESANEDTANDSQTKGGDSKGTTNADGSTGDSGSAKRSAEGEKGDETSNQAGSKADNSRGSKSGDKKGESEGSPESGEKPDSGESGEPQGANEIGKEKANDNSGSKKENGNSRGETGDAGAGRKDDNQSGSPTSQGENRDRQKTNEPDGGKAEQGEDGKSPSISNKQSDSKGENAGDRSGGGGEGGGQDANQAGKDTAGSNSSADSGAGASDESGEGETSGRGGNDQTAKEKTGTGSEETGSGSGSQADPEGDKVVKRPGDSPGSQAGNPHGGSGGIGDSQGGAGLSGEIVPGDKAKLEYAEKATDLALDYLRDQDTTKDPELLDELGWTEEELESFIERWAQLKRKAKEGASAERNELSRSLRSLGLRPDGDKRRAASDRNDQFRDLRDDGFRETLPSKYLEQFKAFQRGAARAENSR